MSKITDQGVKNIMAHIEAIHNIDHDHDHRLKVLEQKTADTQYWTNHTYTALLDRCEGWDRQLKLANDLVETKNKLIEILLDQIKILQSTKGK